MFKVTLLLILLLVHGIQSNGFNCQLKQSASAVLVQLVKNSTATLQDEPLSKAGGNVCEISNAYQYNSNCCSCSNEIFLCSSLSDIQALLESNTNTTLNDMSAVFIRLLTNITLLNGVVEFNYNGIISITSVVTDFTPIIACQSGSFSGLVFKNSRWVSVTNVKLNNCGGITYAGLTGAIQVMNSHTAKFEQLVFKGTIGSAIVFNNYGINPTGQLLVSQCGFYDSSIDTSISSTNPIYGGGVCAYISGSNSNGMVLLNVSVSITDSVFHNNQANYGGGVAVITGSGDTSIVDIYVTGCSFVGNAALRDGGAYYQLGHVNVEFSNCTFSDNIAYHFGGAVNILGQNVILDRNRKKSGKRFQVFNECEFVSNKAFSYAVIYYSIPVPVVNESLELRSIKVRDNKLSPEVYDTDNCMLLFNNVKVLISNGSDFVDNIGSVVCLDNTDLYFSGDVLFQHNFGYRGGALNMKGQSVVTFSNEANVYFTQNSAVYGGAIYKGSSQDGDIITGNIDCIFDFKKSGETYTVTFEQNVARLSGFAIYIVNSEYSEQCLSEFEANHNVKFEEALNRNIETASFNVEFSSPVMNNSFGEYVLDVSLGIYLTLNTNFSSIINFNSSAAALFYVTLKKDSQEYFGNSEKDISLVGPAAFSLSQGLTLTNLFFTGPEVLEDNKEHCNFSNFSLTFKLAGDLDNSVTIDLTFIPCKLGFEYDSNKMKCTCVQSPHLLCNERQNLACIERGYWYGGNGTVIPCYSGFCNNTFEQCVTCELESGGSEFCALQESENEQCIENRANLACVFCRDGYSYTYGARRCINKNNCNPAKDITIIIFTSILFLFIVMVLFYILLKLHSQNDFGYFYAITYYYSVIGFILPNSLVNDGISAIDIIFQSFITLNPVFLGLLDVCFNLPQDIARLVLTLVDYLFPILTSLLIGFLIILSKKFPKLFNYKDNVIVKGICMTILLSFSAILKTSFNIINPVIYNDKSYVSLQPDIEYLGKGSKQHQKGLYIFSWIVAMLFMLMFILPVTIFLLFSPLIMRYCNQMKIKPFLDQFHACYKEEYRWMAGFYLLCRLVYFAIIIDPMTTEISSYPYIRYVSVAIVIIHCILQPYNSKLLNIGDAVILTDIAFLSLIHDIENTTFFNNKTRVNVTYTLLYIPVLYLILLSIVFIFKRSERMRRIALKGKMWLEQRSQAVFTRLSGIFKRDHDTRRGLLEESELDFSFSNEFNITDGTRFTEPREPLLMSSLYNEDPPTYNNRTNKPGSSIDQPDVSTSINHTSKPHPLPKPKPNFFEMTGPGLMSPGKRQGSFLVQYVKYRENSLSSDIVTEVTADEERDS